jgi:hypothetical protein
VVDNITENVAHQRSEQSWSRKAPPQDCENATFALMAARVLRRCDLRIHGDGAAFALIASRVSTI